MTVVYASLLKPRQRGSSKLLQRLFDQALGICAYCGRLTLITRGREPLGATIDHVIPRSNGGTFARANLALACRKCNGIKGNMMPDEWAAFMAATPRWWASTRADRRADRRAAPKAKEASASPPTVLRGGYWVEK